MTNRNALARKIPLYRRAAQKRGVIIEADRMLDPSDIYSRSRGVAFVREARPQGTPALLLPATRTRKGLLGQAKGPWRRGALGTNHISAHGVWRKAARRAALRINRTGETRWHRLPSNQVKVKIKGDFHDHHA